MSQCLHAHVIVKIGRNKFRVHKINIVTWKVLSTEYVWNKSFYELFFNETVNNFGNTERCIGTLDYVKMTRAVVNFSKADLSIRDGNNKAGIYFFKISYYDNIFVC